MTNADVDKINRLSVVAHALREAMFIEWERKDFAAARKLHARAEKASSAFRDFALRAQGMPPMTIANLIAANFNPLARR